MIAVYLFRTPRDFLAKHEPNKERDAQYGQQQQFRNTAKKRSRSKTPMKHSR